MLSFAQAVSASAEFRAATEARSFSRRAEEASVARIGFDAGRPGAAAVRRERGADEPRCPSSDGVDSGERPFPSDLAGRPVEGSFLLDIVFLVPYEITCEASV